MGSGILGDPSRRTVFVSVCLNLYIHQPVALLTCGSWADYGAPHRESTTSEPFILIPEGLHHYDGNGLFPNESTATLPPQSVKDVHSEEVKFVKAWMDEWDLQKSKQEL